MCGHSPCMLPHKCPEYEGAMATGNCYKTGRNLSASKKPRSAPQQTETLNIRRRYIYTVSSPQL